MTQLTQTTNTEFDNTFSTLQADFNTVTTNYATTITDITANIKFDHKDTDEALEKLIDFAAEQERLTKYSSVTERLLRKVQIIPWVGKAAKESADAIRTSRLNEESVSGLVSTMYDGLIVEADSIKETEQKLLEVLEAVELNIQTTEALNKITTQLIEEGKVPRKRYSEVLLMSVQTQDMLEKYHNKVATLNLVIPCMRECLKTFAKALPVHKSDLTSDLAISTGVAQLNEFSTKIKHLNELGGIVATNIYSRTQTAITNMIETNTMSEADIKQIEDNSKRREELYQNTMKASQEASKQLKIAHVRITDLTKASQAKREQNQLLLAGG